MAEQNIEICNELTIPLNAATKTFAILAKRGAGKTYTAGVLAEELFKNNIPFVVFDPIDVWWGLRLKADGKEAGLPIVIFGLDNADIKLDRNMGREIAQQIVKKNISCVISTFGMPKTAQRQLIAEFSDELLRINNTPRHVFIEEAHEFVPQRVLGGLGVCFNAVSNLVVMGRNRGIGVSLINQRAATLNKDVLTQIDTLIALRNVAPQDRKALKEWVEYHTAEGDFEKFMAELPSLPNGVAWVWSPEFLNLFERVHIRSRETFHPDREKLGINFQMPTINQGDVEEFIKSFPKLEVRKSKEPLVQSVKVAEETQSIQQIKNEYDSKLIQKDIEIRQLKEILEKARLALGVSQAIEIRSQNGNSQISMWLDKLGKGMPHNLLKFLLEHQGLSYSKSQLGLGCGYSPNSGSFSNALSLLRRNGLIIQDSTGIKINPDL